MRILGLSCFYHDAAACLIEDGRIVAAVTEEAFSRKKHDSGFPKEAIRYVLAESGLNLSCDSGRAPNARRRRDRGARCRSVDATIRFRRGWR